ncbi:hypothetical protein SADO_15574 [Salinisphaera dokdonensis CL-ES53]|uniref:Glycosyltransferase subfamily 4-like N-terminal domain-containing protein n=1 Tax=Salinisphaera dokdonensis CL-ES53 TaxID=1304272 RepID=A0ABV2B483_9GAMM
MKNALFIAYDFPPSSSSTGQLRTLAFCRHLPDFGWQPAVLTATANAYPRIDRSSLAAIPDATEVARAFAFDAKKVMGLRGNYPVWVAQPDRWWSWWFAGVIRGLAAIRRHKPQVIWSTYPITTAHLIGLTLHRLTGLPWIADFRDPVGTSVLKSPLTDRTRAWVERATVAHCARGVFTTRGAAELYRQRFPEKTDATWQVIPNGYDEGDFSDLADAAPPAASGRPVKLLHSGVLYREHRDPQAFFVALAKLKAEGLVRADNLVVVLRASGNEAHYDSVIRSMGIEDIVRLEPAIPYREALAEQMGADGLLLWQGERYNRQIPAKVYEYFRTGRPMLALVEPGGDTANLVDDMIDGAYAPMNDADRIREQLMQFLTSIRSGCDKYKISPDKVSGFSRRGGARQLAEIFNTLA